MKIDLLEKLCRVFDTIEDLFKNVLIFFTLTMSCFLANILLFIDRTDANSLDTLTLSQGKVMILSLFEQSVWFSVWIMAAYLVVQLIKTLNTNTLAKLAITPTKTETPPSSK